MSHSKVNRVASGQKSKMREFSGLTERTNVFQIIKKKILSNFFCDTNIVFLQPPNEHLIPGNAYLAAFSKKSVE